MTPGFAALTNHDAWGIALIIGLVAALAVAGLLLVLIRAVGDIKNSVASLLDVAGKVATEFLMSPTALMSTSSRPATASAATSPMMSAIPHAS